MQTSLSSLYNSGVDFVRPTARACVHGRLSSLFRVANEDYWGDLTSPPHFIKCAVDVFRGHQCLAGYSNGSIHNVSVCSDVRPDASPFSLRLLYGGRPFSLNSVARGDSVNRAPSDTTLSLGPAIVVPRAEVRAASFGAPACGRALRRTLGPASPGADVAAGGAAVA